ncbi:MAG: BamA/TamA family outer membrane protein, partial [Calditrichia bacterium]|nr:BamA/TamA family outer membrane protein [Calditrichia bacterium]
DDFYKKVENKIIIDFNISEGKRYYYDSLRIVGNSIFSKKILNKFFKLIKKRDPYNQIIIDNAVNQVENYYYDKGYPYVQLDNRTSFSNDSLVIAELEINSGPQVIISNIETRGVKSVRKYVVRREVAIKKNEIYSREKINKTQKNLYATGLFETVNIQAVPDKKDSTKATLMLQVSEKDMRYLRFRVGVGYEENISTGTTFEPTAEFGHLNLGGHGRTFSISFIPSLSYDFNRKKIINPQNQFTVSYKEPWILKTKMPGLFQVGYFQRNPLNSPNYDLWNYSFQISKDIKKDWRMINKIEYQFITDIEKAQRDTVNTDLVLPDHQKGTSIKISFVRDKRNNMVTPSHGYLTEMGLALSNANNPESASLNLEPSAVYLTYRFGWNRYQAFHYYKKWILASRIKMGYIQFLGKETIPLKPDVFYLGA